MTTPERETAITITLRHYSHKELADAIEAALLAAKAEEREACAKMAEAIAVERDDAANFVEEYEERKIRGEAAGAWAAVVAIRARGAPAAVKEEQGS